MVSILMFMEQAANSMHKLWLHVPTQLKAAISLHALQPELLRITYMKIKFSNANTN